MNNDASQLAFGEQPKLMNSNIKMGELVSEYRTSSNYRDQYTRDFPQLDDLVDGIPLNADPDVPFIGDTTLASWVRSLPRQSLQQLPVFSAIINGAKNSIPALIGTFLLKEYVFNEDTFGKGLLSTLQLGMEQSLTHGYAPFLVATGMMYNDMGSTMRLLHYVDSSPEPGITDSNESGYHYVIAHLPISRIRKIYRAALRNPDTTWDVDMLKQLLDSAPQPTNYSPWESTVKRNNAGESASPSYEIVTRYETGQGGTIITFCPTAYDRPLRVIDNKSKWGYPRVQYLVIDPAALTPFGTSRVRLASPNQNLANIYLGQIAAMLLLNSKPPLLKRGRFTKPVQLVRGAVWETLDQNASVELKNMDNGALEQFVPMQQQFAIQIQNIMMGSSGAANGPGSTQGFSKTAPGVAQQQKFQDTSSNQITKIAENFLRQYALVGLDTILCEQDGEEPIIVDDDTMNKINEVAPGTIGDNHEYLMVWAEFYASIKKWSVEVTVSVSEDELEEKERGDLQDMLVVLAQNAKELGPAAVQKVAEITDMLMKDKAPRVKPLTASLATGVPGPAQPGLLPPADSMPAGPIPA